MDGVRGSWFLDGRAADRQRGARRAPGHRPPSRRETQPRPTARRCAGRHLPVPLNYGDHPPGAEKRRRGVPNLLMLIDIRTLEEEHADVVAGYAPNTPPADGSPKRRSNGSCATGHQPGAARRAERDPRPRPHHQNPVRQSIQSAGRTRRALPRQGLQGSVAVLPTAPHQMVDPRRKHRLREPRTALLAPPPRKTQTRSQSPRRISRETAHSGGLGADPRRTFGATRGALGSDDHCSERVEARVDSTRSGSGEMASVNPEDPTPPAVPGPRTLVAPRARDIGGCSRVLSPWEQAALG